MLSKQTTSSLSPLLTGKEVAELLKISPSGAYSLMRKGEIPSVRFGRSVRVREADLEVYITSRLLA